jgi:DNA repair exonuclease SbcCD ATPase subunit
MAEVTVNEGDFVITSSGETEDAIRAALAEPSTETETDAAPAEEPEAVETESVEDKEQTEIKPPKKSVEARKKSIQAEIDELTAKRHEARRAMEAEAAELQRLRAELSQRQAASSPPPTGPGSQALPPPDDAEPTIDAFDNYEAFVRAQAQWAARQVVREAQQQDMQRRMTELHARENQQRIETFSQKWNEAATADPTFVDSVRPELLELKPWSALTPEERQNATVYNAIAEEILRAENGPQVLRYLSENFDSEFRRLASLQSPDELRWSMAKLQGRLEAASSIGPVSKPKPISSAKPPIKPMGSAPSAGDDGELSDDLPIEEYIRRANHRDRQNRAGR